jgi:hypothetical protein
MSTIAAGSYSWDFRLQSYLFVCLFDFCLIPCEFAVYLMMMMMMMTTVKVIYTMFLCLDYMEMLFATLQWSSH